MLTVRIVARLAAWRPDGPSGCALGVNAFAEEGKPPTIPGPLLRVRAGTEVRVTVRNTLPAAIWVLGFQDRSGGMLDSTQVAAGASHEFRFVPKKTGAWFYSAGTSGSRVPTANADGQLVGALVVDPATTDAATLPRDRVLVMTRWTPNGSPSNAGFQLNAFNGRSWPNSEHLTYTVNDSVRWHVINASNGVHEMHLHGFFFRLDDKGFAIDTARSARPGIGGMRVTAVLRPGEWLTMTWVPERPGNWLYHCHVLTHMSGDQRLDRMTGSGLENGAHGHRNGAATDHATHDMGGLVLGIDVKPSRTATAQVPAEPPRRMIDLYANTRAGRFGGRPGYGFVVQEGNAAPARDSIRIPGSPLILTRGEPVRITVHNRVPNPVSVHWHGLELESYFDGVGGFSGAGTRIAPMIAPNDSFVVRITPPRAGTFMYHVHGERGDELSSGLYGPLIVVEPGKPFDPRTDLVFMFADGGPGENPPVFINGTATPDTLALVAGTEYRFRLLFIGANDVYMTTLRGPSGPVPARLVAFDGHDVTRAPSAPPRPLALPTGPGHAQDFAVTFGSPGDYALDVQRLRNDTGVSTLSGRATTVAVRVR